MTPCAKCGSTECKVATAEQTLEEEQRKRGRAHDWDMVAWARGWVREAKAECDARALTKVAHGG